jgi:hypothetical protein
LGQLVFQATLGGQVNLVGPNTASTFNINVPATAGTMVTTGDTGTVTSTMLATAVYTAPGTIGSGTPNTGAFTTLSGSTSVTTPIVKSASSLTLQTNGTTTAVTIDTAQNMGLGVTPSAWSLITPLQVKNASFAGYLNRAYVFANSYFDGSSNKYIASDFASYYAQQSGQHQWYNAASGTAGNVISFTQAMTLDASGNLGVGTSSPSASAILDVQSTTKGVCFPNMTTTQKNAISSPATGLVVFDTTLAKLCVYSGSAWQTITSI